MPAGERAALEVVQSQAGFQLAVVMLDAPPDLGKESNSAGHSYGQDSRHAQVRTAAAETFQTETGGLKHNEIRDHGEYRTKRLVLAEYDRMAAADAAGVPYESPRAAQPLVGRGVLSVGTLRQPGMHVAEGSQHETGQLVPVQAGNVNVDQAGQPVAAAIEVVMKKDRAPGGGAGSGGVRPVSTALASPNRASGHRHQGPGPGKPALGSSSGSVVT